MPVDNLFTYLPGRITPLAIEPLSNNLRIQTGLLILVSLYCYFHNLVYLFMLLIIVFITDATYENKSSKILYMSFFTIYSKQGIEYETYSYGI